MNIFEKLQKCRVELQKLNLKKTGKNTYSGYSYYELSDFLPSINKIMLDNKLFAYSCFDKDNATLTFVDTEKPEQTIVFTTPMSEANLKGCHSVQNLGAVQTYLRRYLYTNAFEIVESDALDSVAGKPETAQKTAQKASKPVEVQSTDTITTAQAKRLFALSKGNTELVKKVLLKYKYVNTTDVTRADYNDLCSEIELLAKEAS